ncbi:MAG TPA: tRNA (adenosine(37)-N6)-threonylcarbamoyltransferase complex transferase subunit TsaD [Ignavibacteriaceae bacterium]|nr:tRNA (adenosine(37)-N6)-threonylcarbamoyltransferase complex transferase subunit TsaD [Ignavibacteriaceae bacterium]
MNILGIETSCDETSVAVLSGDKLKANLISSQDFHREYGGVVPELSSRAHLQILKPLLEKALSISNLQLKEIDVICATAGPGLIGALLVGLTFAKGLTFSLKKPFIGVNHIEGHVFSGFLMEDKPEFPFIALVVSGGHTLLLYVKSYHEIFQLGTTVDDAAGEAFDKVAKLLGLGYPGGAKIQELSESGNADEIDFPVASLHDQFNFSFSGLKTSVLRYIQKKYSIADNIPKKDLNDIAASFQKAIVTALIQKCEKALNQFKDCASVSLVGGVAANKSLRSELTNLAVKYKKKIIIPDIQYCGDNAAMIAFRGKTLFESGVIHDLNYSPYPSLKENQFLSYQ